MLVELQMRLHATGKTMLQMRLCFRG